MAISEFSKFAHSHQVVHTHWGIHTNTNMNTHTPGDTHLHTHTTGQTHTHQGMYKYQYVNNSTIVNIKKAQVGSKYQNIYIFYTLT